MFTKVFCIFMGNKVHDYDRKEIYAGEYPGAGAGRGICVRQQSERNARRRGGPLFKDAAGMANVILPRTFADILSR